MEEPSLNTSSNFKDVLSKVFIGFLIFQMGEIISTRDQLTQAHQKLLHSCRDVVQIFYEDAPAEITLS
jgi:hypothetical protein